MVRPELDFAETDAALEKRLSLLVSVLVSIYHCKVVEHSRRFGANVAWRELVDFYNAGEERLGLLVSTVPPVSRRKAPRFAAISRWST